MAKLQLYIAKSLRGYKSLMNIHPDEEVRRYITDFLPALEGVEYDASRINIFHLLSYHSGGVLLTLIRTIPDGAGDHIAATVFVADKLQIEPAAVLKVLSQLTAMLSGSEVSASDAARLRALFDTDYPTLDNPPAKVASEGRTYLCARVGGDYPTLPDYAETGFYTPAFGDCAGVLLLPPGMQCAHTEIDLHFLPQLIPLNPPPKNKNGFTPHIYKRVFDRPYLVPEDEEVEIVWRRGGFDNIVQTVKATGPDALSEAPDAAEARKTITPATFYITAERSREPIEDVSVTVNGREITGPVVFTFAELQRAQVEISAPGYFNYSGRLDLATTTQALVQLKELRKTYRFDLPVVTPEPEECVHFVLESKRELTKCPVEGYTVSADGGVPVEGANHTNTLIYVGGSGRRMLTLLLTAAFVGLLLGILVGWLSFGFSRSETVEAEVIEEVAEIEGEDTLVPVETVVVPQSGDSTVVTESVDEAAAAAEASAQATEEPAEAAPVSEEAFDVAAAKQYLDANSKWKKVELEAIGLNGLFEDLNTYNFDRLKTYWGPMLEGSRRFDDVIKSVNGAASKPDPRRGTHAPTYNREGDETIAVYAYRCHIDP